MGFHATRMNLLAVSCTAWLLVGPAWSQDWTQFRGPGFGTHSGSIPTTWDAQSVVWKAKLPGPGSASPVTFGNRVYVTCYTGYGEDRVDRTDLDDPSKLRRHVLCLALDTGKIVWQKTVAPRSDRNQFTPWAVALHGYASSTPAVDDTGLYVFLGDAGCIAFTHDGEERWTFDCGTKTHMFGSGSSPVLYKNLVIVNACPESGDLIAMNKSSGKEVWRHRGINQSWGTPALYRNPKGVTELALGTKGSVRAFNPDDGSELWSCTGIRGYVCPSVVVHAGVVYAIGGKNQKRAVAVRSGGSGDVTETHKLWQVPKGSNVGSPVIHEGHLYWAKENGVVYCANAKSGEIVYEQRLQPTSGRVYGSPVLSGGNLYYVSREKGTFVVAAKPEFELVAHNVIDGDKSIFNASPVPTSKGLLLRSDEALYLVGPKTTDN